MMYTFRKHFCLQQILACVLAVLLLMGGIPMTKSATAAETVYGSAKVLALNADGSGNLSMMAPMLHPEAALEDLGGAIYATIKFQSATLYTIDINGTDVSDVKTYAGDTPYPAEVISADEEGNYTVRVFVPDLRENTTLTLWNSVMVVTSTILLNITDIAWDSETITDPTDPEDPTDPADSADPEDPEDSNQSNGGTTGGTTGGTQNPPAAGSTQRPDGVYSIFAEFVKAGSASLSMANDALVHIAKLEIKSGAYYITLELQGRQVGSVTAYLDELGYYDASGNLRAADVTAYQTGVDGASYPLLLKIPLVNKENSMAALRMFIPYMESLAAGNGTHDVSLRLDWSSVASADAASFNTGANTTNNSAAALSPAFAETDAETGIRVSAAQGVLPEGVLLHIVPITSDEEDYIKAQSALGEGFRAFVLYDISFTFDGEPIQPDGKVEIYLPIPAEIDAAMLESYRINDDETKTLVTGEVEDDFYVITVNHFSLYMLAVKADDADLEILLDEELDVPLGSELDGADRDESAYSVIDGTNADDIEYASGAALDTTDDDDADSAAGVDGNQLIGLPKTGQDGSTPVTQIGLSLILGLAFLLCVIQLRTRKLTQK
ncbi:MAG: NEAT domain-containing protein [Peptococcaceae bacterium]|jgi:LPXTG-motif cell wall-anchored protein|nr:NEAT domain-containing protein [Peptococcaceae bacterium]